MTEYDKERCRSEILKRNWIRVSQIDPEPDVLLWNTDKEVRIIYEDMDGQPCMCNAVVIHDVGGPVYFRATTGPAICNRMSGVIAYKEISNTVEDTGYTRFSYYEPTVKDLQKSTKSNLIQRVIDLEHRNNLLYKKLDEYRESIISKFTDT
jgi:hypothetical protein